MGNSLQDQLLKAGLADEKQAKKARAAKVPKKRGKKSARGPALSESAQGARQAMAEKAEKDRALNEQRKADAERKAIAAQIRQLVEQNRLPRDEGEIGYNFVDEGKVRKLYVTADIHGKLGKGRVDIVRMGDTYELVPAEVAEKIRTRDASRVLARQVTEPEVADDDPYKDYQVPDDLMW
jgi:uncharacterized protein YaiL (DUF2058 family)